MKKLIALALCLASITLILCSCKPKTPVASSTPTENVSSMLEEDTSSVGYSEDETSSVVDEEEEPEEEEEEEEETSSKNKKPVDRNPSAQATTTSSSIKLPDIDGNTMEIGCYMFTPRYTNNYRDKYVGDNTGGPVFSEGNLEEFEDVLSQGYFNTLLLEPENAAEEAVWQIVEKYKMKVWIILAGSFTPSTTGKTVEELYNESSSKKAVDFIKKSPSRWKLFNGFAYDEIIHRGYKVEDFKAHTEFVYKKLGKRNFPVMACQEFTSLWPIGHDRQTTDGCTYFTDISFDMYAGDVRDGAEVSNITREIQAHLPNYTIKNAKDAYRALSDEMVKLVGHPVTVWYYPSAQYLRHDDEEGYCLAQLKFFENLLKEQDHPGGLILYVYAQAGENYGLQSYLDMGPHAEKTIRRYENQVWKEYSAYLKQLTMRYRLTKNNPVLDLGV